MPYHISQNIDPILWDFSFTSLKTCKLYVKQNNVHLETIIIILHQGFEAIANPQNLKQAERELCCHILYILNILDILIYDFLLSINRQYFSIF